MFTFLSRKRRVQRLWHNQSKTIWIVQRHHPEDPTRRSQYWKAPHRHTRRDSLDTHSSPTVPLSLKQDGFRRKEFVNPSLTRAWPLRREHSVYMEAFQRNQFSQTAYSMQLSICVPFATRSLVAVRRTGVRFLSPIHACSMRKDLRNFASARTGVNDGLTKLLASAGAVRNTFGGLGNLSHFS